MIARGGHSVSPGHDRQQARRARPDDLFAAAEVRTAGWGGLVVAARITSLPRSTINRGENDLDAEPLAKGKIRRSGGGRRAVAETDPELVRADLQRASSSLPSSAIRLRPLIWVSKSMDKLAETLTAMGHPICADTVRRGAGEAWLLAPARSQGR